MKHTVRLDGSRLRKIISETVKNVLREDESETNLPGPKETDKMIEQLAPIRDTFKRLGYDEAARDIQEAINTVVKIKNEYARRLTGYDYESNGGFSSPAFRKLDDGWPEF